MNPPRGMRDFLPAEKARRDRVLDVITGTYRAHGFDEIETPVMEDAARLHSGLGGDNEKLAFGIMKRALKPEDLRDARSPEDLVDLGLRFDLTVPLARFYATNRARTDSTRPSDIYRADRGELYYGTAEVSIPHDHVPGALEAPSILSFDVVEDPDKHIVLRAITPADLPKRSSIQLSHATPPCAPLTPIGSLPPH